jgi:hypothetical protein
MEEKGHVYCGLTFPLGELTPSPERRSLSLTFEPAATHAPTDLGELGQAHLPG